MQTGFSKVDITPKLGVELSGYGYFLGRTARRVLDPLFARAVSFRHNGKTILLIDCDLVGLDAKTVQTVKDSLKGEYGLESKDIMLLSIHTHSGPAVATLSGCGEVDAEYVSGLAEKFILAAREALQSMKRVEGVSHFVQDFEGIGYNRVLGDDGPVDARVRGVIFEREGARPLVLINYACHPVVLGRNEEISADYPGRVVAAMDDMGYEAVFLNGFCGDIDPAINRISWGSGTAETIKEYGKKIADAALEGIRNSSPLTDLTLDAMEIAVELPLQIPDRDAILEEMKEAEAIQTENPGYARIIQEWNSKLLSEMQAETLPKTESEVVHLFRIGDVLLVGFPGEAFTRLGLMIKEAFPDRNIMTLGNANVVMRYIPTADDIQRRGYAGYASCRIYSRLPLEPGAGEKLAETAIAGIRGVIHEI